MFSAYPTYSPYRTLAPVAPVQMGEDVYALQNAINIVTGGHLTTDGVLGPKTASGIRAAQAKVGVTADGKAGVITQRALALAIARGVIEPGTEFDLTRGQLQHESSYLLGNYSALRPDGSYDAGVAQMNTEHTNPRDGFNPTFAIARLISHTKDAYGRYSDKALFKGDDHSERRRWALAAGAWNAPAFANYLSGVRPWAVPSETALRALEDYMSSVTVYL